MTYEWTIGDIFYLQCNLDPYKFDMHEMMTHQHPRWIRTFSPAEPDT